VEADKIKDERRLTRRRVKNGDGRMKSRGRYKNLIRSVPGLSIKIKGRRQKRNKRK